MKINFYIQSLDLFDVIAFYIYRKTLVFYERFELIILLPGELPQMADSLTTQY